MRVNQSAQQRKAQVGMPVSPIPGPTSPDDPMGAAGSVPPSAGNHRRLALNAAAGGAANFAKIAIQLVLLPVMAHLLGPAEFGLYALALPTVTFFIVLADGGLGSSLARESEASETVWSTAFWVLLIAGVSLALIVSGWGYVLANLSHEPRLFGLTSFLSISLVLITLSVVPSARLTRRGDLVVYSAADVTSTFVGGFVAVGIALSGGGAWSLAAQYVCGFFVRAVVLNAVAFYRPSFVFHPSALLHHVSTGSAILGTRLVDFVGRMTENLLVGRSFGAAGLGEYTLANQVPRFICDAAQNPVWAALYAHALHAEPEEMAMPFSHFIRLLASVLFPVSFLLSASAPALVTATLGEKWHTAGELIATLTPFYAFSAIAAQGGAILLARHRNAITFWVLAGSSVGRVLSASVVTWVGLSGIVWGIGIAYVTFGIIMLRASSREMGLSTGRLVEDITAPLAAGIAGAVICNGLLRLHTPSIGWIVLALALSSLASLLAMVALDGRRLRADFASLRRTLGAKRPIPGS